MKCPRCVQSIHSAAEECPHCGFTMSMADAAFGGDDISLSKMTDTAGVLRMKEREPMRKILRRFEARFPQLFVAVYLGAFEQEVCLRQFGFWMLNRTVYRDLDEERSNTAGILILVDVNSKSVGITFGYALLPYLDEDFTFQALAAGHPSFIEGDYLGALRAVIQKLEVHLIKGWKKVRRNPDKFFAESGQSLKIVEDGEVESEDLSPQDVSVEGVVS